jgi:hypothetical protein
MIVLVVQHIILGVYREMTKPLPFEGPPISFLRAILSILRDAAGISWLLSGDLTR